MTKRDVPLGFEVGTGRPVAIPLHHLVVTGLTQHAGKTTTIEALVTRSKLRAVCFVTKRGEIGFRSYREIRPYFKERADWQYVEAILEAAFRERMKFERSWLMRACKGATTLAQVHANVRTLLKTAKGIHESVYTALDHYLQLVVPQIQDARLADRLELGAGLNLMELEGLSHEMQALVIRSTIDTVMEKERDVVVVIPEAWAFLPQTRGGPVKAAAELLVRQGAVLGNFMWADSQDISGVDKRFLKSAGVWILGCQTEANEAEHTLRQIPVPRSEKPAVSEIQALPVGHFFACWGGTVRKVYVQPSWLDEATARAVARGQLPPVAPASVQLHDFIRRGRRAQEAVDREIAKTREDPSMCEEHQRLQKELTKLQTAHEDLLSERKRLRSEEQELRQALRDRQLRDEEIATITRGLQKVFGAGGAVNEDELVRKILARIPTGTGGAPLQVTPPAKLRKDFQREETDRVVTSAKALKALPKRILKLLEGSEGAYVFQKAIAERLGRSTGGGSWIDLGAAVKELAGLGFVEVDSKRGVRARLRQKLAEDLGFYQAADAEIEEIYQAVLYELAVEPAP